MTRPLGSLDFFVLEATDCLGRIEQLVAAFETPPADELLRAARALRGAAVLAQHVEIAEAAAGFELVARALKTGLRWDATRRQQTHQAVESFRFVVRSATQWSDAAAERARSVGRILVAVAGDDSPVVAVVPSGADALLASSVRAFIAREGALVASALAEAARRLREHPEQIDALQEAARRLMALRGLGEIRELSPLPEILDAIELLADDVPRIGAPPPALAQIADASAAALARVCREVAGDGRPSPEAPDARHLISLVFEAVAVERDVLPIAALLATDAPLPIAPDDDGRHPMGALALVSLGEHLTQTADVLARAPRLMQRELRGYAVVGMLRRTASLGGAPALGLRSLLRGVRAALAAGMLRDDPPRLAAVLREAAALLRQVSDATDRRNLSRQLAQLGQRLADATRARIAEPVTPMVVPAMQTPVEPPPKAPPVDDLTVSILDLLAEGETPIVPINRLVATAPPPDLLVESWRAYEAFVSALPVEATIPVVPIAELLFRGAAAQQRARHVTQDLQHLVRNEAPFDALAPLIDELRDLLDLADAAL